MSRFHSRVVVIAGGATGIGAATAQRLAAEGATVVIGDVNVEGAGQTAAAIADAGGTALAREADLADPASIEALIRDTVEAHGRLDVLHCNGADMQALQADTNVVDIDLDVWDRTLQVDLRGYVLCCRFAIPAMVARGGGAIVMTASGAMFAGEAQRPAYAAAKAGIGALVRHITSRWARKGVRANAIAPGLVLTEGLRQSDDFAQWQELATSMIPRQRLGTPEDIAAAVAFLASDDADWITGQVLCVDGGSIMR